MLVYHTGTCQHTPGVTTKRLAEDSLPLVEFGFYFTSPESRNGMKFSAKGTMMGVTMALQIAALKLTRCRGNAHDTRYRPAPEAGLLGHP